MANAPQNAPTQFGLFVPTNYIWDIQQLQQTEGIPDELKELLVRLYQNIGVIAMSLNAKDSAFYSLDEFVTGQQFFSNPSMGSAAQPNVDLRQTYRMVVNFGALPATTTKSVPHGIVCNAGTTFTRIYATASDTTGLTYIPIPYASTIDSAHNVELYVDSTNVNIITGTNRSNYNVCYVVLEYMKF